jgi:hypothetical protein
MTTGVYEGYTITQLEKLCLWELGNVIGTTASYAKFPRWLLRSKFNERQNKLVEISQCLKKMCLIPTKDGRRTYRLPANCMDGGLIAARYYTSTTDYVDLEFRTEQWLDAERPGWRVEADADPEVIIQGPTYGSDQSISVYPTPPSNAASYADAVGTGIYLGTDLPGSSSNIAGTCDSVGNATTLNDSTSDFTQFGLVAGMAVLNLTDGSVGKLLTIADHQLILSSALTGGTANIFDNADSYLILAGEYAVVTDPKKQDRYIFATEVGMLDSITIPAYTLLATYVPFPRAFPWDSSLADASQEWQDIRPEVPKIYHYGLAMGVDADMLRTFNEGTREFQRAEAYEAQFAATATQAKTHKTSRPYQDLPASFRPDIGRVRRRK